MPICALCIGECTSEMPGISCPRCSGLGTEPTPVLEVA